MALKSKSRVIRKFVPNFQDARTDNAYPHTQSQVETSLIEKSHPGRIQDARTALPWEELRQLRWGPAIDDPTPGLDVPGSFWSSHLTST